MLLLCIEWVLIIYNQLWKRITEQEINKLIQSHGKSCFCDSEPSRVSPREDSASWCLVQLQQINERFAHFLFWEFQLQESRALLGLSTD